MLPAAGARLPGARAHPAGVLHGLAELHGVEPHGRRRAQLHRLGQLPRADPGPRVPGVCGADGAVHRRRDRDRAGAGCGHRVVHRTRLPRTWRRAGGAADPDDPHACRRRRHVAGAVPSIGGAGELVPEPGRDRPGRLADGPGLRAAGHPADRRLALDAVHVPAGGGPRSRRSRPRCSRLPGSTVPAACRPSG